jgi:hypothetical protein
MNNIEILEKLKDEQYTKETVNTLYEFYDEEFKPYVLSTDERNALENLIKENKELKDKCKELNFKYTAQWVDDNFIPKSKVKEKIEELEKQAEEVKNHYKGTYACLDEYLNAKSKIQGFKELLEGE